MREILFRGKQKEGRWVEGVYFKHDTVKACFSSDDPKPRHLIIQDGFCDWGFEPPIHGVDVDPETVGQFTGLTDKNGKKIFEGDIVLYPWNDQDEPERFTIKFKDGQFLASPIKETEDYWDFMVGGYSSEMEVIGNIHDNPELLEVGNGTAQD